MSHEKQHPIIKHNTFRIISANPAACELFRCEECDLVDQDLIELIADPDMQGLARARLKHIRTTSNLRSQDLPLFRMNGTKFWATVTTRRIDGHHFESDVIYKFEMPRTRRG